MSQNGHQKIHEWRSTEATKSIKFNQKEPFVAIKRTFMVNYKIKIYKEN